MSDTVHKFPYKWNLADGYPAKGIEPNGCKVFGTFICGGGSTMGYKLAGYSHFGGVEIDPKIADVYKENHRPSHLFIEDIRQFNERNDLPPELFDLDILDGSPPCSTFSMAGSREKAWGKKKVFREGQAKQTLDDLVFVYCDTIEKLKPKICLLENVKGIIQGNAKVYSKEIVKRIEAAGYKVQVFCLNAASMGVPQKRERVFFIGHRKDFDLPGLVLRFDEKAITFGDVFSGKVGRPLKEGSLYLENWNIKKSTDKTFSKIEIRKGRGAAYGTGRVFLSKDSVSATIVGQSEYILHSHPNFVHDLDICQIGSYPLDYNFKSVEPKYLIGMSVPPVMTAQIAHQIWVQWLSKTNRK